MPELDISYHDPRISMNHWWPRLEPLDVPTPDTELIPLDIDNDGDGFPVEWDTDALIEAAAGFDTDQAFIRGDRKSASMLEPGAFVPTVNETVIDQTVTSLMSQTMDSDIPMQSLAIREWLDLDAYAEMHGEVIAPEVRVFIDNGDILCHHLRVTESDLPNPNPELGGLFDEFEDEQDDEDTTDHTPEPEETLAEMQERIEEDIDHIRTLAQRVANEFDDGGWSVDFLLTETGDWVCTDMALYGLYYNQIRDNDQWTSISYHPADCPHNLETNPPDNLPETPENARTERLINLDI